MSRTDLVPAVTAVVLYKRVDGGGLRLNPWQWGFAILAPLALIIIDLRLLGGWLMAMAPAAFWIAALIGWIPLALSQKRWHNQFDVVLNGMLAACAALALLGALLPILVFFFARIGEVFQGEATLADVGKSTLLSVIALGLTWPLLFTAAAFRRQAKLRVRWRPDLRSKPGFIGMAILPVMMIAAEAADRLWFSSIDKRLNSHEVEQVLDASHDLRFYPVTLMTRTDEVCSALYARRRETIVDAEDLDANLDIAWGDRANSIRSTAHKFFGAEPTITCADALSSGPF